MIFCLQKFEKTHTPGFISALEFVFVAARIALNVLERRKKDKITAEMKPHLYTLIWLVLRIEKHFS
jgi:hypothetical protein